MSKKLIQFFKIMMRFEYLDNFILHILADKRIPSIDSPLHPAALLDKSKNTQLS